MGNGQDGDQRFDQRFSKLKAKRNCDEEKLLTFRFAQLSAKLQIVYSEDDKAELERIKIKL